MMTKLRAYFVPIPKRKARQKTISLRPLREKYFFPFS